MITLENVSFSQSMEGLKNHKKDFSGMEDVKSQVRLPQKGCPFFSF